ncbi:MAG: manganese-dependent inorganic pyrophosphatase [Verrucomicrobiales bacterium]|jgi:manganese-dependent inorganic pyrophosphatase
MSPTYVIGHKNPDTDAICSAIAYTDLLQRTRRPEAIAARCGTVTARTEWVLKTAGVEAPELVMDVRLTVGQICKKTVATAAPHESFLDVYQRMLWGGYRSIPIVEGENQLVGLLSLQDLLKLLLPVGESPDRMRIVRTSIANMQRTLDGEIIQEGDDHERVDELVMMVAGSSEKVMEERLTQFPPEQLLLITGDRANVQKKAVERGVRCLIVTGGFELSEEIRQTAEKKNVPVLMTRHDTASTVQFVRGSRQVADAITHDFHQFEAETQLRTVRETIRGSGQPLFPVVEGDGRQLVGVFSRSELMDLPKSQLVLVDHNEFSQAVTGAEDAQILEVVDHHRLSGNLVSKEPIRFINLPVGSTCTIVALQFRDQGLVPARSIATCLCAGIISDTLNLTSPTTTDEDRKILDWLSKIAQIDIGQFTEDFFAAGSVLKSSTIEEALNSDRKEYDEAGYRVSISQIEELGLSHFWEKQEELHEELRSLIGKRGLDIACVMVTDIGRHFSVLLIEGPEKVLEKVDYPRKDAGVFEMDGVVSRKKQLFPWLSRLVGRVPKES